MRRCSCGGVTLPRPERGRWVYGSQLPAMVERGGVIYQRSLGLSHPGAVAHYREAVPRMARHLYVLDDGTYEITHRDYHNPDYGLCAMARHLFVDVARPMDEPPRRRLR